MNGHWETIVFAAVVALGLGVVAWDCFINQFRK